MCVIVQRNKETEHQFIFFERQIQAFHKKSLQLRNTPEGKGKLDVCDILSDQVLFIHIVTLSLQCLLLKLIRDAINPFRMMLTIAYSISNFQANFTDIYFWLKFVLYLRYIKHLLTCLVECPCSSVLKLTSEDAEAIWKRCCSLRWL